MNIAHLLSTRITAILLNTHANRKKLLLKIQLFLSTEVIYILKYVSMLLSKTQLSKTAQFYSARTSDPLTEYRRKF